MKKIIISISFISFIVASFFYILNKDIEIKQLKQKLVENNINNKNNINLEKDSKWNYKYKLTEIDIRKECNKVLKGQKSKFLSNTNLYNNYLKALRTLKKNEYIMFIKFKKWKCNEFESNNKEFCENYKNKSIKNFKKWTYEYSLLKSLIYNKNYCDEIKNKEYVWDCIETFKGFYNIENIDLSNFSLSSSNIEKWFYLYKYGKDKYIMKINKLFYKDCIKIK